MKSLVSAEKGLLLAPTGMAERRTAGNLYADEAGSNATGSVAATTTPLPLIHVRLFSS